MLSIFLIFTRAGVYLNPLVTKWNSTFNIALAPTRQLHDRKALKLLEEFAEGVRTSGKEICPNISESLEPLKDGILETRNVLLQNSMEVFDKISEAASAAHRLIRPQIKEFMVPTYEQCAAISGKLARVISAVS